MSYSVIATTSLQIVADLFCCFLSLTCATSKGQNQRTFFIINCVAFVALTIGDIYYNYLFRILRLDIKESLDLVVTVTMLIFQLSQAYNWFALVKQQKVVLFSSINFPYLLFTIIVIGVFVYYFLIGHNLSSLTIWYQIANLNMDMLVWFFAIICLARTRTFSIILLTLGCLILISADLATRCLFMLDLNKLAVIGWIHIVWTLGVIMMASGFLTCLRVKDFNFCHANSIQASCCFWMSITSFIVFMIGFIFILFFHLTYNIIDIHLALWSLPIDLVFTIIIAVLLGNRFSNFILLPVNDFLKRIQSFNSGEKSEKSSLATGIYEFEVLSDFMDSSFKSLSSQLDREIKIAAQVAHDIRSPLAALEIVITRLPKIDETKWSILRDIINHMRDIINNLEKNSLTDKGSHKSITQVVILVEYVISERRVAFSNRSVSINYDFDLSYYGIFIDVVPSELKRVLTNIINNACEAVMPGNGTVNVEIMREKNSVILSITDNGIGVSKEVLTSLFTRGFTTKTNGSGLGLYHARECLTQWGGTIDITSNAAQGTTVQIRIPINPPPSWFVDNLSVETNSTIICVDDCVSIFHAWQDRFSAINSKFDFRYCSSKEDLLNEIEEINHKSATFLVDYEFSGKGYNGLDLINIIFSLGNPNNKVFLVTSRSHEIEIQKFCGLKSVSIIPKYFASKIPLKIIKASNEIII